MTPARRRRWPNSPGTDHVPTKRCRMVTSERRRYVSDQRRRQHAARAGSATAFRSCPTWARRSRSTCARTGRASRRGACSCAPSTIVARYLARAGLAPATRGAHLLRHGLATRLPRQGASMSEIGELLRHRKLAVRAGSFCVV